MSNSCLIATEKKDLMVYLHWNGGIESVAPFLKYCEYQNFRAPEADSYGWTRLCQVIGNFFGGSQSFGIMPFKENDWGADNGMFIMKNWTVINNEFHDEERMNAMLKAIDERQPEFMRLGSFLDGVFVDRNELKVGDVVYVWYFNEYKEAPIIGIGEDRMVNGTNVKGIPYVDVFGDHREKNINNYVLNQQIRKKVN